jgi:hypothetical protein
MKKRLFPFVLSVILVFSFCNISTFAVEDRASKTLNYYNVGCKAGSTSGTINISYDVQANSIADSVGIESIVLYSSTGVYMTTILGSTQNGLIKTNNGSNVGTYTQTVVPGNSYYAIVTVFAEIGDNYDSRKVSTNIVTAP